MSRKKVIIKKKNQKKIQEIQYVNNKEFQNEKAEEKEEEISRRMTRKYPRTKVTDVQIKSLQIPAQ